MRVLSSTVLLLLMTGCTNDFTDRMDYFFTPPSQRIARDPPPIVHQPGYAPAYPPLETPDDPTNPFIDR